jgi:hypothetical protein
MSGTKFHARWLTLVAPLVLGGSAVAQSTEGASAAATTELFVTSSECIACHSNLTSPSGEDISIGYNWRASMMANSARDPYWHAGVRRESMDHPEAQAAIEDKCSTCHMPMMRFTNAHAGGRGQVFATLENQPANALAMDGVSCTVCHQIQPDNFGQHESFDGGFEIETETPTGQRHIFGPHDVDGGHERIMNSASRFVPTQTQHLKESELCGTCHTLYTQALGPNGTVIGELAEQMPYQEWLHSDFRNTQSCQDCHMPELAQETAITSVLGVPRPGFSQHVFRGANAFMQRLFNKYRNELGVTALPQELNAAAQRSIDYLGTQSARLTIGAVSRSGNELDFTVAVQNLGGHKLPTAYPSRRVWLHVAIRDSNGAVVFESGALRPDGSIVGNDNDEDGTRFEPHYREITAANQVQIYEPVLADQNGRLTTGLLSGVRYIKDNRLLPRGFDKATATPDIAVNGEAATDPDFIAATDSIRYRIALPAGRGPLQIDVELMYQSIGFRWAENLKAYDAAEPQRFVRYYADLAAYSGMHLASASTTVPP